MTFSMSLRCPSLCQLPIFLFLRSSFLYMYLTLSLLSRFFNSQIAFTYSPPPLSRGKKPLSLSKVVLFVWHSDYKLNSSVGRRILIINLTLPSFERCLDFSKTGDRQKGKCFVSSGLKPYFNTGSLSFWSYGASCDLYWFVAGVCWKRSGLE